MATKRTAAAPSRSRLTAAVCRNDTNKRNAAAAPMSALNSSSHVRLTSPLMSCLAANGSLALRNRRADEVRQVVLELGERRLVDVHHVARFVIAHADVLARLRVQAQVIDHILGCVVWRAEIEVAIADEDLQIGVACHGGPQLLAD